jgi:hypothetical protein
MSALMKPKPKLLPAKGRKKAARGCIPIKQLVRSWQELWPESERND